MRSLLGLGMLLCISSNSYAEEYSCPSEIILTVSKESQQKGFEAFPDRKSYSLFGPILYFGHPEKLGALKGRVQTRSADDERFWLKCRYNQRYGREVFFSKHHLIKKLPKHIKKCEFTSNYKALKCS